MKTKILIFNLIVIFSTLLFILKSNDINAFISRRCFGSGISESEIEILDNNIMQSINEMISEYNPEIFDKINIKLYCGIVNISGSVNSLRDREKIIAIIKTVKGVRGVIDNTILTPILRGDKDIRDDIVVSFLDNPSVYAPRITIKVLDAVVTLSGSVANSWEKEEAENVTKGIAGVVTVKSDLLINSHIILSNLELMDAIKAMVRGDEYLFNNTIIVEIQQGRVLLQGVVDTASEKVLASAKVSTLGVKEIENQLTIGELSTRHAQRSDFDFQDLEIEKAINDTIRLDDRIDPPHFDIFVKDGIVTLNGNVQDVYQKSFLDQDILNVPGVQFIDNALIAQETIRSDGHIIKDIERFLQSKPNLAVLDILVTCNAGDVTLEGKIATIAEKVMLKGIIRNISGIKEVFSHLQIEGSKASYNRSTGMKKNRDPSDILHWNMDIGNSIFQISVDRPHKTVTIRGDVKDLEQKDRAEHLVRLRAPDNFSIINKISIIN
ncbi:MAG: BON domain-containing protein [bacterium]